MSLRKDSPEEPLTSYGAERVATFTESVIRDMTRLARAHDAVNLAQGFPDFPAPDEVKEAAVAAIRADVNQYPITWGAPDFRQAIAASYSARGWADIDPEREITVMCGSTEAMAAAFLALIDPGSEVVLFEPFYENYGPDARLAGSVVRTVALNPPDWTFDPDALRAAIGGRTRAIVVNTPHNPTGKVFAGEELELIASLCIEHDLLAFTDEIYEQIVYDGATHHFLAQLPGMAERTVTISALSKTYSVTGWRVGWAIATPGLGGPIRKVHDFLTVAAPAPLQAAGVVALGLPASFYRQLRAEYQERRDRLCDLLERAGFTVSRPAGAYYVIAGISDHLARHGLVDDRAFAQWLVEEIGVAGVPGSSFYARPELGAEQLRFAFPKRLPTLDEAGRRLARLAPRE